MSNNFVQAIREMIDEDRDGATLDDSAKFLASTNLKAGGATLGGALGLLAGPGAPVAVPLGGIVGGALASAAAGPVGAMAEEAGDFTHDLIGWRRDPADGLEESDDRHYRRGDRGLGAQAHDAIADLWGGWMDD